MALVIKPLPTCYPGWVPTTLSHIQPSTVPVSAISASSAASNSQQGSPIMSHDTVVLTTSSSVQLSPEPMHGRDEDPCPSNFPLPETILSRKTRNDSLGKSLANSNPSALPEASPKNSNLIRRFSNRAHRFASRRQQSSAAPASRNGSIGPSILRRRSDSNATAPPRPLEYNALADTDEEADPVPDGNISLFGLDGATHSSSNNSAAGSIDGSASAKAGPVLPAELRNGCRVLKVSRRSRTRRVKLVYETESNKLLWDPARSHKSLHVDEIKEIRTGSDIQQYCLDFGMSESCADTRFTIIYTVPDNSRTKLLHIVTDNEEGLNRWTEFLEATLTYRQESMTSLMAFNDGAMAQYWQTEMIREFGHQPRGPEQEELDMAGVKRVCQNLHIYCSQWTIETNFGLSDVRRREKLNFTEFKGFVRLMKQRHDVQRIIRSLAAKPETGMTLPEFLAFLRDVQGEEVDSNLSMWEKQFAYLSSRYRPDEVETSDAAHDMQIMSEAAFVRYLTSESNSPIVPEPQNYTLDRPMNEYIISSSHNTYLLGRQVAGQSSVEGYISVLVRGCRCVEVDCWDGNSGQPEVNHGRTLTTSISFREVMTTINKYAFVKSRFPLWISLEVHCNPNQQAIMVNIMKEAFGSRLVTETLEDSYDKLPSPSELMERILIKVKKPQIKREPPASDFRGRRRGNSFNSALTRPVTDGAMLMPSQSLPQSPMLSPSPSSRRPASKTRVNTITEGWVQDMMSSSTNDNESGGERNSRKTSIKTVKELGDLGVYCAGVNFAGFDAAEAKQYNHIFSFMESRFAKHFRAKEQKMAVDLHNRRYMMRVYPDRTRITSNNFDPLLYWRRGIQMAALNWQTFDLGMQINRAMFDGGRDFSGYVLKPAELREIQVLPYNPELAGCKKERSVVSFTIDVISAQQLMPPANLPANKSTDPYVEVEVFHASDKQEKKESALPRDFDSPQKFQTSIVRENGFNPMFDGQFKFKATMKQPDLVFVRWSVKLSNDGENYDDGPAVATYTAKLGNLKQGYRTLPLLNHAGDQYLFSKLFCKIKVDSIEKMMIDTPSRAIDSSRVKGLGGIVFSRISTSPRSTIETSSTEKTSFDKYP
ncbi:PLC-like phosphodiesterase [Dactylonectria macrodidyma]|uniref:Phosphoinositide phospholipase C n=1 Tax=Dactylonectria macrodidyma TaxID=307937 RepID=A0A9P9I6Z2_9HYPO|nr:PLC-like phosphodiesterase [Dactylonectria macrodidyma]